MEIGKARWEEFSTYVILLARFRCLGEANSWAKYSALLKYYNKVLLYNVHSSISNHTQASNKVILS